MSVADKLTQIANNVPLVYDAGYEKGKAEGGDTTEAYNQGVKDGKQAEYDAFWDAYLNNGNRANYEHAFCGEINTSNLTGWTDENFKPKYPMKPLMAQNMFYYSHIKKSPYLKNIDFSKCEAFINCFTYSTVEELGVIDSGACLAGYPFTGVFSNCKNLHTIEKWIPPRSNAPFSYPFNQCTALVNITVEGAIKQSISFQHSTLLSKASITSIVNALSDTASGMSLTLPLTAVNNAFENGRDGTEWQTLISTKPNWTIAYA